MDVSLNIFTLNCWGIPLISRNRKERMRAIAEYLSEGKHNIVCLQEVWSEDDYIYIRDRVTKVLPYSHYFYSGVVGSGLCVLSAWQIEDVFFHQWSLNGYVHKVQHGDWFGGKGVGLCRLRCQQWVVHVYCTHLHAEYSARDPYLAHRVLQAHSTAELVKLSSHAADLAVLAGDLNTQPGELSYRLVTELPLLSDPCCRDGGPALTSGTSEVASNSYSDARRARQHPEGKRIDHILYRCAPGLHVEWLGFCHPLPDRVPGEQFSYSDHNAVSFQCRLSSAPAAQPTSEPRRPDNAALLSQAKQVCLQAEEALCHSRRTYLVYCMSALLLLVSTVGYREHCQVHNLLRIAVTGLCFYCLVMATLWNRIELNALKACISALNNRLRATDNKESSE